MNTDRFIARFMVAQLYGLLILFGILVVVFIIALAILEPMTFLMAIGLIVIILINCYIADDMLAP